MSKEKSWLDDDDLEDTGASRKKPICGSTGDKLSGRKRLTFDELNADPEALANILPGQAQESPVAMSTAVVVHSHGKLTTEKEDEDGDTSSQDSKRSKKDNADVMDASHILSASSEKGLDRLQ